MQRARTNRGPARLRRRSHSRRRSPPRSPPARSTSSIVGPVTRIGMDEAGTLQRGPRLHRRSSHDAPPPLRPPDHVRCSSTTRTTAARSPAPGKARRHAPPRPAAGPRPRPALHRRRPGGRASSTRRRSSSLWTDGEGFDGRRHARARRRRDRGTDPRRDQRRPRHRLDEGRGADQRASATNASVTSATASAAATDRQRRQTRRDRGRADHCPERVAARLYLAEDPTIIHLRQRASAQPGADCVTPWRRGRSCVCAVRHAYRAHGARRSRFAARTTSWMTLMAKAVTVSPATPDPRRARALFMLPRSPTTRLYPDLDSIAVHNAASVEGTYPECGVTAKLYADTEHRLTSTRCSGMSGSCAALPDGEAASSDPARERLCRSLAGTRSKRSSGSSRGCPAPRSNKCPSVPRRRGSRSTRLPLTCA